MHVPDHGPRRRAAPQRHGPRRRPRRPQRARSAKRAKRTRAGRRRRAFWARWSDERLLDLRLCDLGLKIEGTWVARAVARMHAELGARGLRVRPHCWLSEEWFSPAGVPGIAVPFYLAHPRLTRLERAQAGEVEGGTRDACLKILRHEAGHAVHAAFELHRRRRWQRLFGRSSHPYPEAYRPRPASRRFVQHLHFWYAQSHPDEDFAETFAVWLAPRSRWRARYAGWPALKKLEYVDRLMAELRGRAPLVRARRRVDPLRSLRRTLRQHYADKRARLADPYPACYDADLRRLFPDAPRRPGRAGAAAFLRRHRAAIRRTVSRWLGEHRFAIDLVLDDMIGRSRELRLRAAGDPRRLGHEFAVLLAARTVEYLYAGREWHAL